MRTHITCPAEVLNVLKNGHDDFSEKAQAVYVEAQTIMETVFEGSWEHKWAQVEATPEFWEVASQFSFTLTHGQFGI